MTHEELRDLIPAYALDALEPEAALAVAAHLPGCDACRAELSDLQAVAAELAAGVVPVEPPAALRARVLTAARPPRRFAFAPGLLWRAGLAAAAALVLLLGGVTLGQMQRIRTLTATVGALSSRLAAQERVLVVLASPTSRTAALHGSVPANVRFVYDRATGQGALVVSDLRDPGASDVYQLWLVAGQEPQSAGVFRPTPGQLIVIPVNADFRRYQGVAISVEHGPQGSAAGPTSLPILSGAI